MGVELFLVEEAHFVSGYHRALVAGGQGHRGVEIVLLILAPGADQLQVVASGKVPLPARQQLLGKPLLACQERLADIAVAPTGKGNQALGVLGDPLPAQGGTTLHLALQVTL